MVLEILYQDDGLVVVNKPAGILVHKTHLEKDATEFVLQILRNQIHKRVYPIHRLDKPTSGALLFALNPNVANEMSQLLGTQYFKKSYLAVVRGYCPESGEIDYPVPQGRSQVRREALTRFRRLATVELPFSVGIFQTVRYSLVDAEPLTGRRHQIRRHFKHIRYSIIGDTWYGDRHHNRWIKEIQGMDQMFLHAYKLTWNSSSETEARTIYAGMPANWKRMLHLCNWEDTVRAIYLK